MEEASTFDAGRFKDEVRSEWRSAAPGWNAWIGTLEGEAAGPALTDALVRGAEVGAGDTVLDLATGYGEPALTAARMVLPGGHVTGIDISGDMLSFAEQRARRAGLDNVRFVESDIETIEGLEPDSFDAVLSRAGLMYAVDVVGTLRRIRSLLRTGGRLAVGVWGTPETVAFAAPVPVMVELLGLEPPVGGPGPFALGEPGLLPDLLARAGFADVTDGTTTVVYELENPAACTRFIQDVAPPITALVADQPGEVRQRVWSKVTEAWQPFVGDDGRVSLPCEAVWACATRP